MHGMFLRNEPCTAIAWCQEIQVFHRIWGLTSHWGIAAVSCRLWSLHPLYSSLLSWSYHMYQSYLEEGFHWFHCALHKCIQKWRFKNDVSWRHKWLRSIKSSESGFSYGGGVAWLCTLGRSLNANKTTCKHPSEILLPSTARNWQDGHSDKLAQTASYAGHQVNCGWFQFQSGTVTIGYLDSR